jgi:hypothetical protein
MAPPARERSAGCTFFREAAGHAPVILAHCNGDTYDWQAINRRFRFNKLFDNTDKLL